MKRIPSIVRHSIQYAFSIVAGVSTVASLLGYTVRDISQGFGLWPCIIMLGVVFVVLSIIIYFLIRMFKHRNFFTTINGKDIVIKIGDLFEAEGWKLIPFNERFDTQVDDKVIAHDTLNGKMIDKYVTDLNDLNNTIMDAQKTPLL